jgi:hypothetical protein
MKRIYFILFGFFVTQYCFSQTISPATTTEFCPNVETTFNISVPGTYDNISVSGGCFITTSPYSITTSGGNTTFSFKGKFIDSNQTQTFTVTSIINGSASNFPFRFTKIKSLFNATSASTISLNTVSLVAQRCQIQNFNISFTNVKYGNENVSPSISYGNITNYEYQLPTGWSIGSTTSTGSNWIAGGNNVTIPLNLPTWQYTAISSNFDLEQLRNRGIQVEILDELYLPPNYGLEEVNAQVNDNKKVESNSTYKDPNFINYLVDEAERLSGNGLSSSITSGNISVNSSNSSFNPQGKIQVFDTRLQRLIPLAGVKVRARRWFTIRENKTNANGDYYCATSFNRPVNYAIFYEGDSFDIRSGTYGQAWNNGPKQTGRWDLNINDGVQRFYAHVFRGAYRYHHQNIGGLKRPNYIGRIKYTAYDKNKDGVTGDQSGFGYADGTGILPDIRIWRSVNGQEQISDEIFSTTIHETAHLSHTELMNWDLIQFQQVSIKIAESWAVAVQWQITSMEYKELGISNYGDPDFTATEIRRLRNAYQYWAPTIQNGANYTSIFIDLVDDYNQATIRGFFVNDNITGYTLAGIESDFLKHSYGFSSLREELKDHRPIGITNQHIDVFMDNFNY